MLWMIVSITLLAQKAQEEQLKQQRQLSKFMLFLVDLIWTTWQKKASQNSHIVLCDPLTLSIPSQHLLHTAMRKVSILISGNDKVQFPHFFELDDLFLPISLIKNKIIGRYGKSLQWHWYHLTPRLLVRTHMCEKDLPLWSFHCGKTSGFFSPLNSGAGNDG